MLKTVPELLKEVTSKLRLIDASSASQELATNNGIVVDVREPAEHLAKPANGAINIPRGLLEMKMLELEKDPTKPLYLHCATTARAALSAEQLQRIGYQNVSVISCDMDTIQRHL